MEKESNTFVTPFEPGGKFHPNFIQIFVHLFYLGFLTGTPSYTWNEDASMDSLQSLEISPPSWTSDVTPSKIFMCVNPISCVVERCERCQKYVSMRQCSSKKGNSSTVTLI